jgi:murein DD-endopeptidase MepM/ murein hydrolase activator NlpD
MGFSRSWLPAVTACASGLVLLGWGALELGRLRAADQATPLLATFHQRPGTSADVADLAGTGKPLGSRGGALVAESLRIPIPFEVEPGETLGMVLTRLGLDYPEAMRVTSALREHVDPRRVRAGTPYTAVLNPDGRLEAFNMEIEGRGEATAHLGDAGWESTWREYERRLELRIIRGELQGALESSIRAVGASPTLTYAMADALQWDLDFNRDLRLGDRFEVVYEEVFLDGKDEGPGRILALRYENLGRVLEAYRFGDDGGFYDAEGRPLRKMFLRSPLRYSARITSGFSRNRFHPVLKKNRPHWGVDYGAPVGTPVRVTAGGVVASAGWNGGGGRTVKVRHPNDYETNYLHLSRFAKGIGRGVRVRQGDVVGYVGSSGLATGPHLDYRVRHRGSWINPQSIRSVPAYPIAQKDLPRFVRWRDSLRYSLNTGEAPGELLLALTEPQGTSTEDRDSDATPESSSDPRPVTLSR